MITDASAFTPITTNQLQFFVMSFNGTNILVYVNGKLIGQSNKMASNLVNGVRNFNYVGKSVCDKNGNSKSYIDDLRFYNKSLLAEDILDLMRLGDTCAQNISSKIFFCEIINEFKYLFYVFERSSLSSGYSFSDIW